MTMSRLLLHFEGLAVFVGCLALYHHFGESWLLFVALFLVPDIAMLGYLAGPRAGSVVYNLVHSYATVSVVLAFTLIAGRSHWLPWLLIWAAHIGFDRALGYGLKYPSAFRDTHFQRL